MKIGILLNHSKDPISGVIPPYSEIKEMAQAVEAHGFDSAWLVDHFLFRFGEVDNDSDASDESSDDTDNEVETVGIWECWTLLSALAEATSRVEWGTLVLCNPFRNPAMLAKMAHTLDEICNGRLILGVGAGWHKPEFDAFGYPFDYRVGRFDEALQIMKPLLNGESVSLDGQYYQVENCAITPLGPRSEGIPLLVASKGPRMLRLTAQYADQWNTAWLGDASALAERIAPLHQACAEVGRDPETLAITVGISAAFTDLGETYTFASEPLTGTADDVAQAFAAYEAAGAKHLQINISPYGLPAVERLAEALRIYRGA